MKKLSSILLMAGLMFLLAACGSDNASSTDSKDTSSKKTEQQEQAKEESSSDTSKLTTEQKKEIYEHTEDEFGDYFLIGAYTEEGQDGDYSFLSASFDNFTVHTIPTLVEIDLNDESKEMEQFSGKDTVRAIVLEIESENDNDYNFSYEGKATAVTDTGAELTGFTSPDSTLAKEYKEEDYGEYGYIYFLLDDISAEPKELEITFEAPQRDGEPISEPQTVKQDNYIPGQDMEI
ncbi:hypothetical protein SAMN04489762_0161 [Terribacillus saccharophilus]|uniref:DUF4352 domain-containing protein n=1 Tax=Terribacillus saccharophilus TaxID=361277 RepID=A0AAX2E963_9BACI|nr:hypothetical protein SAMN04489762_0161 [Terribacillus saccharophilus]